MEKADTLRLILGSIFGVAAVILFFYGDIVGVSMMAAAGIALFLNYFLRKAIYKDEMKKDEMTKRISSIASEFALFAAISTIGILTVTLSDFNCRYNSIEDSMPIVLCKDKGGNRVLTKVSE